MTTIVATIEPTALPLEKGDHSNTGRLGLLRVSDHDEIAADTPSKDTCVLAQSDCTRGKANREFDRLITCQKTVDSMVIVSFDVAGVDREDR